MNIPQNARLTPKGRALLVRRILAGETPPAAAAAGGVSERTARRWLARYRSEGEAGLDDRSSRPRHSPRRTPQTVVDRVVALRRQRWTGRRIARTVGVSPATVSRLLRRAGLNRLRDLEPAPPVRRYEHHAPGERLPLDIKKLGRFQRAGHRVTGDKTRRSRAAGWEFVHVAVDDHSRIAFSQILPDERSRSAVEFLHAAVAYYRSLGVGIRRLLTDNGSCYRSRAFRQTCRRLGHSPPLHTALHPPHQRARPSASSKLPSAHGPTPAATFPPHTAPPISTPGSTTTTGIAPTPASAIILLSADSPLLGTTC